MAADETPQGGSVPAQLDEIIELLGQPGAHGFQEVVDLANNAPEQIPDLVAAAAARLPRGLRTTSVPGAGRAVWLVPPDPASG